jgi:response regulator RpfG family c-di-GMP phosphodiesterase
MEPDKAAEIIISESGSHFDPEIVRIFTRVKDDFAEVVRQAFTEGNEYYNKAEISI